MKKLNYLKTFLAAMLLLVGSNYVEAAEPTWTDYAVEPEVGKNYYIYNKTRGRFICFQGTSVTSFDPTRTSINLGPTTGSSATERGNQAVLFKLESGTTSGYYKIKVVDPFGGKTWYMSSSMYSVSTSAQSNIAITEAGTASGKKYYYIYKKGNSNRLYMGTSATTSASISYGAASNAGKEWYFIPEESIKGCSVSSKKADGTISITAPTDKGKTSVTFNVSGQGTVSNFTWTSSNSKLKIGIPTRSGNVVTVPVHYTAENKHGLPIETATITLTSKDNATSKTGTANANVNLQPTFSTVVSALDWNRVNEEIVERFYVGMDVAASERDRLANKLLVTNANTMAKRTSTSGGPKTVWTATIIGDNADQFKFPNGTQSYSGNYVSDNFLSAFDVHYAPTVAGEHTATLRIVASYTAANGAQTDTHDITLSGRCEAGSIITFASDDSPSDDEIYSFGNIIGTNKVDVTANLLISQVTDLQKVWSDPDGVFEFDPSSVNLSKVSQTLTFSAHRETPVTANTNHQATLTISGTSTVNGEPVSATFTLRYTAVPLTQPTVTWNWSSIREGLMAYNPITTNSDGNWTLTKTAGDKLTYNPASNKNEATAEYLHHEPGQSAAFYLQIPQTDTYAAFEGEYETAIDVSPVPEIYLDLYSQYTDPSVMTYKISEFMGEQIPSASFEETQNKLTIDGGGWVDFFTAGHNVISFRYDDDPDNYSAPTWTVTEYYGNNTSAVLYEEVVLTSGTNITWQFSPNATKIRIEETGGWSNGFFTNVRISEYDVIAADAEIVALIDDNGTVSDRDVTLTFANKRQVTATLNETAAQYFTIVDATPAVAVPEINLTQEIFDAKSLVAYESGWSGSASFEDDVLTISSWIEFMTSGQSKISFHYKDGDFFGTPTDPIWTVTEYDANNTPTVIYEDVDLTSGTDVTWSFSKNATKIRIEQSQDAFGDFTNVRIYGEAVSGGGGEPGSSVVYDSEDGLGVGKVVEGKVVTVALKDGVNLADAKAATAGNACQLVLEDDYAYDHEVLTLPIAIVAPCDITYKHSANGTYVVTYQGEDPVTVSSADLNKHITDNDPAHYAVTLSAPAPASGYRFQGWKINDVIVSCKESFTTSVTINNSIVEAAFVAAAEVQNFKVGDVYFEDLGVAATAAGTSADSKIVTLMRDLTLGDGSTPVTYTIPAGVTLLIPHKADFFELQETPEVLSPKSMEEVLAAYRTLTLKEGVTINCSGNICVAGKLLSTGGGNKSAYTTGECGVINMANGGHIELNNGAHLFCWGYIKGQDMDQGNNTVGTGTVTANSGATVWENFELGDWRGGTASFNIYQNNEIEHRKLFPFQSYALQNVEIPTSFMHGSTLRTFTSITTGFGHHDAVFSMVGPENTMFLLTDEQSVVRMWYDPTTDLSCYELSGTAKLDALHVTVYVDMSSENFILPISNSMHIILKDCNMNLANPLMVQAGAIVEIKPTATVNLTSELYLYDVDQWGKYVHDYYFRSFNNLTSHKNRGAENSKAGLDDAKLIVDGIFNVQNGGKLYTTAGGANVMGNGGGQISFKSALPADNILWAVTVLSGAPYINWVYNDVKAANLCNEDGSYTRSIGGNNTFYNINGRWFHEEDKDEQEDHTYWFTYMADGNSGADVGTAAVYSHDKTGLEARMKWFNVEEDACANWWTGTDPAAFYNYSMLNDWHQFIATETEKVYSGSNNKLYQKEGCVWLEEAEVDENCLYTFEDGKKALVNGDFIPLTSNGYDPAYHKTDDASKYYICFTGCNWHPAMPYVGESKAYTIHPEDEDLHYIWFNSDWLNVLRDEPFFYTEDEITNVRTYYEYVNGEWEIATPYVSVTDDAEERNFYDIHEAFRVASIKKNATIKLLRDLPNTTSTCVFETQNTTCTLDLNGHVLGGTVANLVTVNAPGCTFTITDNAALKIGKITTTQSKAVYAQKGTVVLNNGTLEATGAYAIECASAGTITINGGYLAAATKCVNGSSCTINGGHFTKNTGLATYCAAHKHPFETADPKYKYEVSAAWTITFVNEATTLQMLHLKPGETPVYTAAQPTKDGYKFVGWNTSIVPATADATYTAQFEAVAAGSKCVTLNSNGGDQGLQYIYVTSGSAVGTLPQTTKEGNTFAGWFTQASGGTQVNASTTVSADVTWYAHYNKNSYTLTWDANGGQLSGSHTSGTVQYGTAITAPTATFEGHTFIGWNVTPASTMPAANTTYKAQWSIAAKHYLQNMDGTYPAAPEATDNVTGGAGEYVTPAVKTYDGFITPATQTVQIGVVTEVTYQYARRVYTITLNANGGTCATASINVKHGATPELPSANKAGLSFDGWFTKAVGGDKITNETEILRNIGTLYAQFVDASLIVETAQTISDTREVPDLYVTTTGALTITGDVTANNFILESNGSTASGQFVAGYENLHYTHAYFDLKINAKNHQWYAVAVPWNVDAETGISVNGKTLVLGKDFDIVYYDGERRAAEGKQKCWSYVEDDVDKTLVPGHLYMIGLMGDAAVVRFEKKDGAALSTTTTSVEAHPQTTGTATDAGWNGVANPALFHAFVNPGVTEGQVYVPDEKRYETVPLNTTKFVVGEGAFVQVESGKSISVAKDGAFAAPRRTRAQANLTYDVRIAPVEEEYTDRLFIKTTDSRENRYTVGQDLAKVGVSSLVPQMWINRYDEKLCVNTAELINETAEYPLGIQVPNDGEYTMSIQKSEVSDPYSVYLTLNGEAIWNLSDSPYTWTLDKGATNTYGLRVSAKAPQITTGIDEAVVDAKGEPRKVMINDKVFIIRGEQVYTIDGQLVK